MRHSAVVAAMLFLQAESASAASDPMAVARAFCEARVAKQQDRLIDMLTPSLRIIVDDALQRNEAIAESSGEEAAPLQHGIPFGSYEIAARECVPVGVVHSDNVDIIDIRYEAEDGARWTDRLVITAGVVGGAIDDILFASFPTDTYHGGLRRILADSFDQ